MSKDAPGLFWVAPFTPTALFHRREFRKAIEAYWMEPLTWRPVESQDWPAEQTLIEDFFHAKRDGYGFVTERGSKKLFIVPRMERAGVGVGRAGSDRRSLASHREFRARVADVDPA